MFGTLLVKFPELQLHELVFVDPTTNIPFEKSPAAIMLALDPRKNLLLIVAVIVYAVPPASEYPGMLPGMLPG
jgi:hypothetical protein